MVCFRVYHCFCALPSSSYLIGLFLIHLNCHDNMYTLRINVFPDWLFSKASNFQLRCATVLMRGGPYQHTVSRANMSPWWVAEKSNELQFFVRQRIWRVTGKEIQSVLLPAMVFQVVSWIKRVNKSEYKK